MLTMIAELQFFVGYPKTFAVPAYGIDLPILPTDASFNEQVPIWESSLECLLTDQRSGQRFFANALSNMAGEEIEKLVAQVCFGGWMGDPCVVLAIDLFHTHTNHCTFMYLMTPDLALKIAEWLRAQTAADWVVAAQPFKHIQVRAAPVKDAQP